MKHFVLLKFESGYYNEDVLNYAKEVYENIGKLENIEDVQVHSNCVDRDSNMDIMIELKVKNKDSLKTYLEHDLHKFFIENVNEHVTLRATFDCE